MPLKKTLKIDDDVRYRVELSERVEVLGETLVPAQEGIILRGDVLKTIQDKVANAEPV